MRLLVTAGNTQVPIDRVRCLTNIFTGRTGAAVALHAHSRGHAVTLLTSHPDVVRELTGNAPTFSELWTVLPYRTFEDLETLMHAHVARGPDAVVHSAAVSDYRAAGVFAPAAGTTFDAERLEWHSAAATPPLLLDRAAGKVKSDEDELWLRLVRTPKLVDLIRAPWGFRGTLVKFKLEVGVGEERLLEIAERSRVHSVADFMVANTLEGANDWAYLGPLDGGYQRVKRRELAEKLLDAVEAHHRGRGHG